MQQAPAKNPFIEEPVQPHHKMEAMSSFDQSCAPPTILSPPSSSFYHYDYKTKQNTPHLLLSLDRLNACGVSSFDST